MNRILVNTGSNMLVLLVKLVLTFIMTPIFVHNLGNYDYGLWGMLAAVLGYMGLLDLGIKPAISRFSAKLKAEGDRTGLLEVYNTTLVYMFLMGTVLLTIFMVWAFIAPETISPEGADSGRYTLLLLILGAQLFIMFPGYVAESYMEGFQLYYLKNNITIVNSIIGSIVIYYFITPDNGLLMLAGAHAIASTIKYILLIIILSRPSYGAIRPNFSKFSITRLIEILIFGGKSLVQGIARRMEYATDSLLIGIMLGPATVPFYSIPSSLVRHISSVGMNLTHAFMPLFSDLSARKEQKKIVQIYFSASKYVIGVVMPIAAGVSVIGGPFIGLWIGDEFRQNVDLIIMFLIVFTCLPFFNPFYNRYLTAINKHGILARLSPVSAILNVVLSIVLINEMGILGAAIGSALPSFIFVPVYLKYTCSHLGIPVSSYIRNSILPVVLPVIIMMASLILIRIETGINDYGDLLFAIAIGIVVYCTTFLLFSLSKQERNFITQYVLLAVGGR